MEISLQPIVITVKALEKHQVKVVYPIINYTETDAFWEMIIGQDCAEKWNLLNASQLVDRGVTPSPGPGHEPNTHYMGHNIGLVKVRELVTLPDEYFEFLCFDSDALSRIAVNKATSEIVMGFQDSSTVYVYESVPHDLLVAIESGISKGQTVAAVKNLCPMSTVENFPRTTLANFEM